jgi:DNA-directed RNA polymerase specialized sigma subunit
MEDLSPEDIATLNRDFEFACSELTQRQKTAVLLRKDGYTQVEIGAMMEISHQSVSRLLKRAGCKTSLF